MSVFNAKIIKMLRKIIDFFSKESSLNKILWLGIGLRILVFIVMNPENPDPHHEVLDYIVKNHRLPRTSYPSKC